MIVKIKRRFRNAVGFRFDAMAAFLLCQHHGVDLNGLDTIPKDKYLPSWIWSAHRSYCMDKARKPMSYDKMMHFVDRMRKYEWDIILNAMTSTRGPDSGDDKKKVQHGMNSSSEGGE